MSTHREKAKEWREWFARFDAASQAERRAMLDDRKQREDEAFLEQATAREAAELRGVFERSDVEPVDLDEQSDELKSIDVAVIRSEHQPEAQEEVTVRAKRWADGSGPATVTIDMETVVAGVIDLTVADARRLMDAVARAVDVAEQHQAREGEGDGAGGLPRP
ncbi:hypothetical protein [Pseudonocardia nigra]|uniref:hypothetical protein n=1 Tax=Pseudonocardia nigra TaxID=1921578 RepID=UPI001C5F87EE|nr:hypothetical protein [Pseudonocardia nigra]